MQTVAETPTFTRQASKLFTEDERGELIDFLAANPLAGDVIPGTGGVRKLRFQASGSGKRGGGRVVYYYLDEDIPLYALLAYAKSARTDLTPEGRRTVATLAASVLCHKYAAFQSAQNRRGQGAARRECLDIGKGRNAALGGFARSRRARRTRPVAVFRPLPICSILAAGRALPQALCGTLKGSVFVTQDTSIKTEARSKRP